MKISNIQIEKAIITKEISLVKDEQVSASEVINKYGGINKIPRNSYLARRISNSHDQISSDTDQVLLWPFFSSHFSLPLKVGETVWCIFDREMVDQGWWITRIHSDEDGEDLSFSCYDRRYLKPQVQKGIVSRLNYDPKSVANARKSFANFNLRYDKGYDQLNEIISLSNSTKLEEPIPKYTKRSGDLVIQGSNNSLICLGTDRYWKKEDQIVGTNAFSKNIEPFSGVVDIVTGRSRSLVSSIDSPKRTASPVYKHQDKDFVEIEKGEDSIQAEGDPDFYYDAARLYVSMKTIVDEALSLKEYTPILPSEEAQRTFVTGSTVFAKADHIRLVARKDDEISVNGSIKIVKEGHINKELAGDLPLDGCSISLLEDGAIHVAGQKIFLGLSTKDTQVEETKVSNSEDAIGLTQPYVKFQELKQLFIDLIYQIGELRKDVDSHIKKFNSHTHNGTCPTGGPITTLPITSKASLAVKPFVIDDSASKKSNQYDEMIEKIKSTRIFGE